MIFKEYCKPFEGDFLTEGKKLLGDQVREFSALQGALGGYPNLYTYEAHLQHVQAFYRIATTKGVKELMARVDPHSEWVADTINNVIQGTRVIDVGCCDGLFTTFYALNHPSSQFIGIDLSEDALKLAQQRAEQCQVFNVQWLCGNALDPSVQESFKGIDTIILQDVLYQIFGSSDWQREQKILRLLSPYQNPHAIVIVTQEGLNMSRSYQERHVGGYTLENYEQETRWDENCSSNVAYEFAVFRKL